MKDIGNLNEILFITGNKHKYSEVLPIARSLGFKIVMKPGYKLEIQSDSLEDISITAAIEAYKHLKKPLMIEDAGLFIDALNGFPGPYSSYVYKTIGCDGILKLMMDKTERYATFRSVVTIIYPPFIIAERGECRGSIACEKRGEKGFGFDPIFIPLGEERTFAEMSVNEKNVFSHRAKAVRKALYKLRKLLEALSDINLNAP